MAKIRAIKPIYEKPTANVILNEEKLKRISEFDYMSFEIIQSEEKREKN